MDLTANSTSSGSKDRSALIVGSDKHLEEALSSLLTLRGWSIRRAPDNQAALSAARAQTLDLVVTGEKTSGVEDVELLRQVRAAHPHTRVIVLTDDSTSADALASMRAHAFSYFSQPFTVEAVADMVGIAMDQPCWDDGIEVLSATPELISLLVRCDPPTATRLLQFFHEISTLPEQEKEAVAFAFREMLLNAMQHGARFDPRQYVEVFYVRGRHMVACRVKDPGEGFTLDELHHAAVSNPGDNPIRHVIYREAAGLPPGGYGILLARHMVDELIYGERGNDVLLVKYLDLPKAA